jgi:hypothetical protein
MESAIEFIDKYWDEVQTILDGKVAQMRAEVSARDWSESVITANDIMYRFMSILSLLSSAAQEADPLLRLEVETMLKQYGLDNEFGGM